MAKIIIICHNFIIFEKNVGFNKRKWSLEKKFENFPKFTRHGWLSLKITRFRQKSLLLNLVRFFETWNQSWFQYPKAKSKVFCSKTLHWLRYGKSDCRLKSIFFKSDFDDAQNWSFFSILKIKYKVVFWKIWIFCPKKYGYLSENISNSEFCPIRIKCATIKGLLAF